MPKEAWRRLDEPDMIESPNLDEFVFCRVLETVEINNHDPLGREEQDEFDTREYKADTSLIVRYGAIRELVLDGKIELLV